jgi:predicted solute-binding protein|tara:strand:+ start:498 stop:737 length:240 start_codon:yes stop_codon:yes gene_type:complete
MKEAKLVELKNKVKGLTNIVKQLIKEIQINATLAQGTLTAFQYHIGEKKWEKLINELKEKEKKAIEEAEEKKLEIPEDK